MELTSIARRVQSRWRGFLASRLSRRAARPAATPPSRKKPLFEALEPRLLLSATLPGAEEAAGAGLRTVQDAAGAALATLNLDRSVPRVVGLAGGNALVGTGADSVWRITGANRVELGGTTYDDVAWLVGSENNADTFVLAVGGSLSGGMHGGPGGFDTLVIEGGSFTDTRYRADGPDSGTVTLDGRSVAYAGLEPVVDNSVAAIKSFSVGSAPPLGSAGDDAIRIVAAGAGEVLIDSLNATFEDHTVKVPTARLDLSTGAGADSIRLDLLEFPYLITIDAGEGVDTIDLTTRTEPIAALRFSDGSLVLFDGEHRAIVRNAENVLGAVITEQGIPQWLEQGPGPVINAQVQGIPNRPVSGAVQAIAQHPFQDGVIFIGSAAGGIWRTLDGGTNWLPLTDEFPSLAIGDITISDWDADGNPLAAGTPLDKLVIYAGTGKFSNSGDGGSNIGMLKSVNGGASWSLVGATALAGLPITAVVPVGANDVLAAALDKSVLTLDANGRASLSRDGILVEDVRREGGVFRSTDGGATWSNLSELGTAGLPDGPVTDLVAEPGNPARLYAGVAGVGVYRSDNGGLTWSATAGALPFASSAFRIVVSVGGTADPATTNRPLYAAAIHDRALITAVAAAGTSTLTVDRPDIFEVGDTLFVANVDVSGAGAFDANQWERFGASGSRVTISAINRATGVITLAEPLVSEHGVGRLVTAFKERASGIYRSADLGATWVKMGFAGDGDGTLNPGAQAVKNFALLADRTNPNLVYASGDRQPNSSSAGNLIGAQQPTGRIFAGTFAPGGSTWAAVTDNNAGGTAPHADSRELVFDRNNNVLQGDDGGIYRLQSPGTPGAVWQSLVGNLRVNEVRSLAYDPINNIYNIGSQDTGSSVQVTGLPDPVDSDGDGIPDDAATRFVWRQTPATDNGGAIAKTMVGDGNSQAVIVTTAGRDQRDNDGDNDIDEADETGTRVLRFTMGNTWTRLIRQDFDAAGNDVTPPTTVVGGFHTNTFGGPMVRVVNGSNVRSLDQQVGLRLLPTDPVLSGLTAADAAAGFTTIPIAVNAVDDLFMLIGLNSLYESSDRLETVTEVQTPPGAARISALAYGGTSRMEGAPTLDFAVGATKTITRSAGLWSDEGFVTGMRITVTGAGANNGTFMIQNVAGDTLTLSGSAAISAAEDVSGAGISAPNPGATMVARFNKVYVRPHDTFDLGFVEHTVAGATQIRSLVFDPDNWRTAYAADAKSVFRTVDGGANWELISEKLAAPALQSLEIVRGDSGTKVLLVGTELGVYRTLDPTPGGAWTEFGRDLPNALARDLVFAERAGDTPDVLAAGLLGRGVFTLSGNASAMIDDASVLRIDGTGNDDLIRVARSAQNASLVEVFVNGSLPLFTAPLSSFQRIDVFGLSGFDTLEVDSTHGALSIPDGIRFDGGIGDDTLHLVGAPISDSGETVNGSETTLTVLDSQSLKSQAITYLNVETVDNDLPESGILNLLGDGLEGLFAWLNLLATQGAETEMAVLGNSLPRALTGAPATSPPPAEDPWPEAPAGLGLVQESGAGFSRLVESGTGAFSLSDIGGGIATLDALRDALDGLDGTAGNVSYALVGGKPVFDFQFAKRLSGAADLDTDFAFLGGTVDLDGVLRIGAEVVVDIRFGVDDNGFFIDTAARENELVVRDIALEGGASASGDFGFLEVGLDITGLTVADQVQFAVDLDKSGGGGRIRFADLAGALAPLIDVSVAGDPGGADVVLEARAHARAIDLGSGSIDLGDAEVTLTWADVAQPTAATVSASAGLGQDLIDFLRVNPAQLLEQLRTLQEFSVSFNGVEVPLLQDSLGQIINVLETINDEIIDPLTNPVSGTVNFGTLQDLLRRLARQLGVDPDELNLAYDSVSRELTWDLSLGKSFSVSENLDLGFDLESGLADLEIGSVATVSGDLDLDLTVGIDLGDLLSFPADPGKWVFIKNPTAAASLAIAASDIDATARFGFLSIGIVDGSAEASGTFTLGLQDPTPADGRINLGELLAALGAPQAAFSGSANLDLPVSAPFLGITPSAATAISIDWPDVTDPETISVVVPNLLENSLGNFTNMDAGTLVSLLGQITSWLEGLEADLGDVDVPFVGQALDGLFQFSALFRDSLLFDANEATPDPNDGTAKLLDADNQATFSTVQELAAKLTEILGVSDIVTYNAADETLSITLSLGNVSSTTNFGDVEVPLDFDLVDLAPLAEIATSGSVRLSAGGGITLTVGVYLGNEGAVTLSDGTLLADLADGVAISQALVIAAEAEARTTYGRLSEDARFRLERNGAAAVEIVVPYAAAQGNVTLADLVADIGAALGASALAGLVTVSIDDKGTADNAADDQIVFTGNGTTTSLKLTAGPSDPAVRELGFAASQTATGEGGVYRIAATVPGLVGRSSADATFAVNLGGTVTNVTVAGSDLRANRNIVDLVADVDKALGNAGLGSQVDVTSQGRKLVFKALGTPSSFSITASGAARTELGLAAAASGVSADIVITTRDGSSHNIVLDGITTLGGVVTAIETGTGGRVDVQYSDDSTRLLLIDTSAGSGAFLIRNAVGSNAASDLGILRATVLTPEGGTPTGDAAVPEDRIESGLLGGVDPLDRVFLRNTQAAAGIAFSTPTPVAATAQFGFVGIEAEGEVDLTGGVSIGLKLPSASDFDPNARISLRDILDNLDNLGGFIDGPEFTGGGTLDFGVDIDPAFPGINTAADPRLTITVNDLGDLIAGIDGAYAIQTTGFDELVNFDDIGFDDIVAALQALVDFLVQFEELEFLQADIPVINVSIADVLAFAGDFADALDEVEANPAATIQVLESKLKEALGMPQSSDLLTLDLVDGSILRIDLNFSPGFSSSLPIDLALPISSDIIDLSGNANLRADGALDLRLAVGIDLDNLGSFWLFEDTGIRGALDVNNTPGNSADDVALRAAAEDIAFTAALGGLGARVIGGEAEIVADLDVGLKSAAMTAGSGGNRRILLADALGNLGDVLDLGLSGEVNGELPVYFPTESSYRGDILIGGELSLDLDGGLAVGGTLTDPGAVADGFLLIPDDIFNLDLSQFSALDNLLLIIDGVDGFLGLLEDTFSGELGGFSVPIIGDQMGDAANVIADFRAGFIAGLRDAVETAATPDQNYISQQLFDLLHNHLHILADRNDDGHVTIADIALDTNVDDAGVAPEDVYMQWNLKLGGVLVDAGVGLEFDLGVPGLGFETRGSLDITGDWQFDLGFGVGISRGGFYIDVSDTNELEVNLDVDLTGAGLTGKLAFLQLDADTNVDGDGNPLTGLGATFGVDVRNGKGGSRLAIGDLGDIEIDIGVAAEANVDIGLELQLNSDLVPGADTVFPKIVGDFVLEWGIGDRDAGVLVGFDAIGDALADGLKLVEFQDVGIDLGTFISDFLSPIVEQVKQFTEPLQPLIDVLTAPIPVISDLAGEPYTLLDLAAATGYVDAGLIYAIADVISFINDIPDPADVGSVILNFGDFTIYDRAGGNTGAFSGGAFDRGAVDLPNLSADDLKDAINSIDAAPGSSAETSKSFTNGLANGNIGDFISFPLFQNPSQLFGLLMGENPSLIEINLPPLSFELEYSQFFVIYGPLGVRIFGNLGATIDPPAFGYDTLGLRDFFDSDFRDPLSLFNGLYLASDVPVVTLTGGLGAAAEINLLVAQAGVGGRLGFVVEFDLHDPDEDGKVRLYELANNFLNEARYGSPALAPLAIFDVSGSVYAELFAYLKVDLLLFSIDEEWVITPKLTLVDFDIPFTRKPTLANELGDGVLRLNMGEFAGKRLEGNENDIAEKFYVSQVDADTVKVWAPDLGVTEAQAQEYDVTSRIIALGGEGDDLIDLSGVTAALDFEVEGGAGNDVIKLGLAGKGRVEGGAGDDEIHGSDQNDILIGG
ncbi:MAG: exo-alpha-sialidase, partial [Burkholderiales bacterium]|nr:exo-alpha-sialidase [Burkholderiales bacterium]